MAFEPKAWRGVLLGIDLTTKGWLILDILSREVVISRDVMMHERNYPFKDAAKPCLIMLKFGTWPKAETLRTIRSGGGIDVSTSKISKIPEIKKLEQDSQEKPVSKAVIPNYSNDDSADELPETEIPETEIKNDEIENSETSTVPNSETSNVPNSENTEIPNSPSSDISISDTEEISNQEGKIPSIRTLDTEFTPVPKNPIYPKDSNTEISPIDQDFNTPKNLSTIKLNLETPELGKNAAKKFRKFNNDFYLKSAENRRLDYYFDKVKNSPRNQDSKNSSDCLKSPVKPKLKKQSDDTVLEPIPEHIVDGTPMWEIEEILRAKRNDNGKFSYYVNYISGKIMMKILGLLKTISLVHLICLTISGEISTRLKVNKMLFTKILRNLHLQKIFQLISAKDINWEIRSEDLQDLTI